MMGNQIVKSMLDGDEAETRRDETRRHRIIVVVVIVVV